jgi:hypothetical protein
MRPAAGLQGTAVAALAGGGSGTWPGTYSGQAWGFPPGW